MTVPRRRLRNLWRTDPCCHWCGQDTVLPEFYNNYGRPQDDRMATLDHLRSRAHGNRSEPNTTNEQRTVLACRGCNSTRGNHSVATDVLHAAGKSSAEREPAASTETNDA